MRTLEKLAADLKARANKPAVKAAAGEDVVPEKDPNDKGGVAIPKDPNATPASQTMPPQSTNSDITPVTSVPQTVKTIAGEEKPAGLKEKMAYVATIIGNLRKKGGSSTAESITPTLPKANNENEDKNKEGLPATDKEKTPKNPDANAKTAKAEPAAMPATPDPAAKDIKKPAGDSIGEVPKKTENDDKTEVGHAGKAASEEVLDLDPMILAKIASLILNCEDGYAIAMRELEKANGAAAAQDIIKAAAVMEQEMNKLATMEEVGAAAAQELWEAASPEEKSTIVKIAKVHEWGRAKYKTDLEKQAYDNGAMMASQSADAGLPDAAAGQHPAESDEVSDEDILAALQQAVQSGEIDEATAAQLAQQLGLGGAGGAGAGGPPGGAGGAPGDGSGSDGSGAGADQSPEGKAAAEVLKKSASVVEVLFKELTAKAA